MKWSSWHFIICAIYWDNWHLKYVAYVSSQKLVNLSSISAITCWSSQSLIKTIKTGFTKIRLLPGTTWHFLKRAHCCCLKHYSSNCHRQHLWAAIVWTMYLPVTPQSYPPVFLIDRLMGSFRGYNGWAQAQFWDHFNISVLKAIWLQLGG